MLITLIQALFFFLPGYFANAAPVIFKRFFKGFLKKTIFGKKKLWKEPVFGNGKTYGGFFTGIIAGILTAFAQKLIYDYFPLSHWLYLLDYNFEKSLTLGFLMGSGALLGDLVKSFFKRRLHIKQGRPFIPFDQLDFLIGGILLATFVYIPAFQHLVWLFLITPWLHFATNLSAYFLKLKKVWW